MRGTCLAAFLAAAAVVLSACAVSEDDAGAPATPTVAAEGTAAQEATSDDSLDEASDAETSADGDSGQSGEGGESSTSAVTVPAALDFTAPTVDGGTFDGASIAGTDAVLYFWAPWCTICRREAPALPGLASEFSGQATFYGVAGLSPDVAAMQGFVADTGTGDLTHIADTEGSVYSGFGVTSQTTFAFIDDSGQIDVVPGPLTEDEVRERTRALVQS